MRGSNAWHSLSCYGKCLLIELYSLHNGGNNGELFLSEREAGRRVGCNHKTASKAFEDLIKLGFIRPSVLGGFNRKQRHATCWILTEFAYAGQLPTKDFMQYGAAEQKKSRHHRAVQTAPLDGADDLGGLS